jgi:hypothetical protein
MEFMRGLQLVLVDVCIFICGIRDPTPLYLSSSDDDEIERLIA